MGTPCRRTAGGEAATDQSAPASSPSPTHPPVQQPVQPSPPRTPATPAEPLSPPPSPQLTCHAHGPAGSLPTHCACLYTIQLLPQQFILTGSKGKPGTSTLTPPYLFLAVPCDMPTLSPVAPVFIPAAAIPPPTTLAPKLALAAEWWDSTAKLGIVVSPSLRLFAVSTYATWPVGSLNRLSRAGTG
jgi:hypothetical protein